MAPKKVTRKQLVKALDQYVAGRRRTPNAPKVRALLVRYWRPNERVDPYGYMDVMDTLRGPRGGDPNKVALLCNHLLDLFGTSW